MMGILKTAFLAYFPPARKRAAARDERYIQARALGTSAADFNTHVALVQIKNPTMTEIDAMDEVLRQLRPDRWRDTIYRASDIPAGKYSFEYAYSVQFRWSGSTVDTFFTDSPEAVAKLQAEGSEEGYQVEVLEQLRKGHDGGAA